MNYSGSRRGWRNNCRNVVMQYSVELPPEINSFLNEGLLQQSRMAYIFLTFAALFWAGNSIIGRAVHAQLPSVGLAFWRWFFAATILLPWSWRFVSKDWIQIRQHWRIMLLLSALGVSSYSTLLYKGLQFTTAINALLMQSIIPLTVVILSYVLFQERLTIRQVIGVVISFLGVILIISKGDWHTLIKLSLNLGDILVLIAAISYAFYTVLLRLRPSIHPLSFLLITFFLGAVSLLPLYIQEMASGNTMPIEKVTFFTLGYVSFFPSILGYLFYNRGIEIVGANRGGLFIHLIPLFGSLMAVAFLDETFQWFHCISFLLILLGMRMVIYNQNS